MQPRKLTLSLLLAVAVTTQAVDGRQQPAVSRSVPGRFTLQEATIVQIQQAIRTGRITSVDRPGCEATGAKVGFGAGLRSRCS